jgi:hypothetical protein
MVGTGGTKRLGGLGNGRMPSAVPDSGAGVARPIGRLGRSCSDVRKTRVMGSAISRPTPAKRAEASTRRAFCVIGRSSPELPRHLRWSTPVWSTKAMGKRTGTDSSPSPAAKAHFPTLARCAFGCVPQGPGWDCDVPVVRVGKMARGFLPLQAPKDNRYGRAIPVRVAISRASWRKSR